MTTPETEAAAALEACAFWQGRRPFHVRDPRIDPEIRDKLTHRDGDTITVADVTLQAHAPGRGQVMVVREFDKGRKHARFRFTLESWREVSAEMRVIYVAGYQAGESAPGRALT